MKMEEARVLVVDDEPALSVIFAKWVANAGCRSIRTAANGQEALGAIREEPIDVLITDVRMPLMDGITLVRTLAQRGERIHTILFVSGFGEVDLREMYDLGVADFLAKPFRFEDLLAALQHAIADRETLWAIPMELPPRQTLHLVEAATGPQTPTDTEVVGAGTASKLNVTLGRRGFSAFAAGPLNLGKVAFSCRLPANQANADAPRHLCGQGYIRWRSKTDTSVGVEIAFLESPGREWVMEQISAINPRSFIPALPNHDSR